MSVHWAESELPPGAELDSESPYDAGPGIPMDGWVGAWAPEGCVWVATGHRGVRIDWPYGREPDFFWELLAEAMAEGVQRLN